MYNKVWQFISDNNMIVKGDRVVAGISGGADSVCLLDILQRICKSEGIWLYAAHINHGIRGDEADCDEEYVRQLCSKWGIEFGSFSCDVRKIASEENMSEEEAGRKVRYQTFYDICTKYNCNKVAVAHNKNDNAETFLFNLFRGTGIKGLSGMPPTRTVKYNSRDIDIIRPLLCVERKEIEEYLKSENIDYRTDSTNLSDDYSRNKIRNRILTYATEEINNQAIKNIHEASLKLQEAQEYIEANVAVRYKALVKQENNECLIPADKLMKEPDIIQKGILRLIMENLAGRLKDIEAKHVDAVLSLCSKQVGKTVNLPYGIIAEREYDNIRIYYKSGEFREDSQVKSVIIRIPGVTQMPSNDMRIETEIFRFEKNMQIPKNCCIKWFDYDKIENAVVLRNRREGDYLCINSSGGIKKLKDYFIDTKIPKKQRGSQLLITDGSHVMWIPGAGNRISEKYKVDENTQNVLLMKLINMEGDNNDGQSKSINTGGTDREED